MTPRLPSHLSILAATLAILGALFLAQGCSGDSAKSPAPAPAPAPTPAPAPAPNPTEASEDGQPAAAPVKIAPIPMVKYTWDDSKADPSVSAEMGGKGFTGEGWSTNLEFPAIGQPGAPKGGSLTMYIPDWPATLRLHGKDFNTSFNYMVRELCQEALLTTHPTTLEYIPALATHWQISEDKSTYRYRINPEARWSNGQPVTADDVVASWKLQMDEDCLYPMSIMTYEKFEEPVAISKYIVEVKCKQENWRNFLYFSTSLVIFPAAEVSIPGGEYLEKYQNAYTAMSGAYTVDTKDIELGSSLTIKRRLDWWGLKNPANDGIFNLDSYKVLVVKDPSLAYEKAKKGELDYYVVPRAQWWVEELDKIENVQRGLIVKRKFYTDAPPVFSGIAINMDHPVLKDIRIRKALQALMNRKLMIEKLFFNEYEPLTSYYQGGTYQNQNNKLYEYSPRQAVQLLEEAGWTEKNDELYRVKDGKVLQFTLSYDSPTSESFLTTFQEDCKKAGIKIELQQLTPAARWGNMTEKEFELTSTAWGSLVFPNPETSYRSDLADKKSNNNVTCFRNPKVDELCKAYDREYDVNRRIEIIREIDGLVYEQFPYLLSWYLPSQRVIYWNKFGMPEWGAARTFDRDQLHFVWWVDPAKEKALAEAMKDSKITLPVPPVENRYWQHWNEQRRLETQSNGK